MESGELDCWDLGHTRGIWVSSAFAKDLLGNQMKIESNNEKSMVKQTSRKPEAKA
jgi:hypothetical protein